MAATWVYWNSSSTSTTTCNTWYCWNESTTAATTTSTGETWVYWNTTSNEWTGSGASISREEYEQQERRHLAELAAERDRVKQAEERAEKLLLENLSARQREEYKEHKHFVVHGSNGRRYRIRHGRVANVDVVCKDGKVLHRLCAHPADFVPNPDTMLAQKLYLEHQEEAFVKIANIHPGSGERVLQPLH